MGNGEHRDDHSELLRCRSRLHTLEATMQGVVFRLEHVEKEQRRYVPIIENMRRADEISADLTRYQKDLAAQAQAGHAFRLSFAQTLFAGVMVLSSVGSLALAVVIAMTR